MVGIDLYRYMINDHNYCNCLPQKPNYSAIILESRCFECVINPETPGLFYSFTSDIHRSRN